MPLKIRLRGREPPPRGVLWHYRFNKFRGAGFTPAEAAWAADSRLRLTDPVVALAMRARGMFIKDYMVAFEKSRTEAIIAAHKALNDRNRRYGLTGADLNNIFREISP